ncbi:MAG: stage II sporulation protein R [Clostridiales bacterium]|uniref:stage II sporulation protein R n=1 Tax=Roseburia sp. MSJ-14 TaxID=2841514 RepID=UPI0016B62107|nr:stage II sporulation protein R [Roseburia sp. MSJ-14]NLK76310.1 stage II sporulation protein R [Clostridiales bacterium]
MKKILLLVVVAICLVIGGKQYQQHKMAEEIAGKIIRFHVLANSDSQEDQNLKLEVRDAIGAFMQPRLANVTDIESSRQIVQESIPDIEQKAEEVISEKGYTYTVSARLSNIDFPEKTYGPYTFQAGNYEALEVVIGEGEGHNWWCVMYPNLCFFNSTYEVVDAEAEKSLEQILTPEEYQSLMEDKNYEIKFAFLDFWKDIKESVAIFH